MQKIIPTILFSVHFTPQATFEVYLDIGLRIAGVELYILA